MRRILQQIDTAPTRPLFGRACPEIGDGYYKSPVGSHVFFYRSIGGGKKFLRTIDGRMEFEPHAQMMSCSFCHRS